MKVIIFTETKIGEGHYQAAKAVAYQLKQMLGKEVKIISGLHCVHPLVEWISIKTYFFIMQHFPLAWRLVYRRITKRSYLQTIFFAWRLEKILVEEQPDIVLCTHPACISALHYLKQKNNHHFRLAAICTDFDFHPFFVSSQIDDYFVPHVGVKHRLITEFGVSAERIHDYGIPLRPIFSTLQASNHNKVSLSERDHRKIKLLILGGAEGLGPMQKLIDIFSPYRDNFQLIVITGKNKTLYTKLTKNNYSHALILGYVEHIDEWFRSADLILTKPGGLTISEAIACLKPCIILEPIPGHEESNRDFLMGQGLALDAGRMETLPSRIIALMQDELEWRLLHKRLEQFHKRGSAERIAQQLIDG